MQLDPNVVAVTEGGEITLDMLLGHVVFYTVPDRPVSERKVREIMERLGLDTELIPSARKAVHVFEESVRRVETRRVNGTITEIKVDRVLEDTDRCVYQVTRLIRNTDEAVIDHPKAMRVGFAKGSSVISIDPLEAEHYDALRGLEEQIRAHYAANRDTLPGNKIRNTLRTYLERLFAENLRPSGGIYFLQKAHYETLVKLRTLMSELYGEEGLFHLIPLANDETQKEMVRKRFTVNTMTAIDEAMQGYADRLKDSSRAVRSDMVRKAAQDRQALAEKVTEYQGLLSDELSDVTAKLGLLDAQLVRLSEAAVPA